MGVVALAAIVGYILKKKRRAEDVEPSPFDRDDFKRGSVMLDDNDDYYASSAYHAAVGSAGHPSDAHYSQGGHSPQMSEYSMRDMAGGGGGSQHGHGGAGASLSSLPGLSRGGTLQNPRPPTAILNHYNYQQQQQQHAQHAMPSFQPGQLVHPAAVYGGGAGAYGNEYQQPYGNNNAPQRNPSNASLLGAFGGGRWPAQQAQIGVWPSQHSDLARNGSQSSSNYNPQLERGPSNASAYSTRSGMDPLGGTSPVINRGETQWDDRPLSAVREQDEEVVFTPASRSGTPVNANVQQSYFAHRPGADSVDERRRDSIGTVGTTLPRYELGLLDHEAEGREAWATTTRDRSGMNQDGQRRLSIRNGGLDDEDAYGGM